MPGSAPRRRLLLTGCLLAALSTELGVAAPPPAGVVVLSDAGLSPRTVTVPVRALVTWINHGSRTHAVRSDRAVTARPSYAETRGERGWTVVVLRPGSSAWVLFKRAGRYPYRVDGRYRGTVLVTTGVISQEPRRG